MEQAMVAQGHCTPLYPWTLCHNEASYGGACTLYAALQPKYSPDC